MKNRTKVIAGLTLGAAALATLLGAGIAGGAANADTGGGTSLLDRIAGKLGIERSALDAAIDSAKDDARSEALSTRLTAAVEAGTITQEEADAISAWVEATPDGVDALKPGHGNGVHGFMGRIDGGLGIFVMPGSNGGQLLGAVDADSLSARLAALVEAGTLTQEEADSITAWFGARPAVADEIAPSRRSDMPEGMRPFRGREFRGHGRGHGMFIVPGMGGQPGQSVPDIQVTPGTPSGLSLSKA